MKDRDVVRISANLPAEDFNILKTLAEKLSITMTDVIRRGIRDEDFFLTIKKADRRILIKDRDGGISTLIDR